MTSHITRQTLQNALCRAREDRQNIAPALSETEQLRYGILNFFIPVYDIFDELYAQNIRLPIGPTRFSRVTSGREMRQFAEGVGAAPQIVQPLNSVCALIITLAPRQTPRVLNDLLPAKWRCRIQQPNGPDLANQLIGNLETLCTWITKVIAEYECESAEPIVSEPVPLVDMREAPVRDREERPTVVEDAESHRRPAVVEDVEPHRRERVIMLDDLTEETHASSDP